MRKRTFTLLIVGAMLLPSCSSPEKSGCLLKRGDTETGMYIEFFKEGASEPSDFNDISGEVGVAIRNIPLDVDKVFVYIDEVQIGNWIRDDIFEREYFGFESDKFSNGWHKVKLVSTNSDEVKNYPPINAYFKNLLYNVCGDDSFSPTHGYHCSGFYDGGKSLEAKLIGIHDDVIWSTTYSGNYIDINIPASAFGKEQLCHIEIKEVQGSAKGTDSAMPDSNKKQARASLEFFQADKYFVPPTDETVAILLYPQHNYSDNYQPSVLFGDEELAEKLMGKSLEPEKVFEDSEWLVKIMKAYKTALKDAEEKKFYRRGDTNGQIIFVTKKKGYIRAIDVDANTVYDHYMESKQLKAYFDELGLTQDLLAGEPNKEN